MKKKGIDHPAEDAPRPRSNRRAVVGTLLAGLSGAGLGSSLLGSSLLGWTGLASLGLSASGCHEQAESNCSLLISAASSLTELMQDLVLAFKKQHPHCELQVNFAGSQTLRLQIEQGARVDVFASANQAHVLALQAEGRVIDTAILAQNELVMIVPEGSALTEFSQLAQAPRIVLGEQNVPVGSYSQRVLEAASELVDKNFKTQVESHVVSRESNVRLVRAKVELAEADAAIVYRTDVSRAHRLRMIEIPHACNQRVEYPIALLKPIEPDQDQAAQDQAKPQPGTPAVHARAQLARAFFDFACSSAAARLVEKRGFVPKKR